VGARAIIRIAQAAPQPSILAPRTEG
jgi:hypothetical protein